MTDQTFQGTDSHLQRIQETLAIRQRQLKEKLATKVLTKANSIKTGKEPINAVDKKGVFIAKEISTMNKWINHWKKQEQFRSLPHVTIDAKFVRAPKIENLVSVKEYDRQQIKVEEQQNAEMTECQIIFRNKKEKIKESEQPGPYKPAAWQQVEGSGDKNLVTLASRFNRFFRPSNESYIKIQNEIKDIQSQNSARRDVENDKTKWTLLKKDQDGYLKFYNAGNGYGFVESSLHKNVTYYCHHTSFNAETHRNPELRDKSPRFIPNQRLKYDIVKNPYGQVEAINIRPAPVENVLYFYEAFDGHREKDAKQKEIVQVKENNAEKQSVEDDEDEMADKSEIPESLPQKVEVTQKTKPTLEINIPIDEEEEVAPGPKTL